MNSLQLSDKDIFGKSNYESAQSNCLADKNFKCDPKDEQTIRLLGFNALSEIHCQILEEVERILSDGHKTYCDNEKAYGMLLAAYIVKDKMKRLLLSQERK